MWVNSEYNATLNGTPSPMSTLIWYICHESFPSPTWNEQNMWHGGRTMVSKLHGFHAGITILLDVGPDFILCQLVGSFSRVIRLTADVFGTEVSLLEAVHWS